MYISVLNFYTNSNLMVNPFGQTGHNQILLKKYHTFPPNNENISLNKRDKICDFPLNINNGNINSNAIKVILQFKISNEKLNSNMTFYTDIYSNLSNENLYSKSTKEILKNDRNNTNVY